ncbi:MAG: hypothetical protein HY842_12270, partial [Bacteroidetes bacterium]|nr:hypothetical protein [Bacteroidota bacterium]
MKKRITPVLVAQTLLLVLVPTFVFGFQPEQQKNFAHEVWGKLERSISQQIFRQTGLAAPFQSPPTFVSPCPGGNLGGVVWQDFNFDGVRGTYETIGVEDVTVQVYDCDGNLAATDISDTDGNWDVDPTNISFPVRVEFSDLPTWAGSTFRGTNSKTTVQFVSAATCTVDLGVANPADYCNTTNPATILSCYESGNAVYGGSGNTDAGIISFPYNSSGATPTGISVVAQIYQVGTVWGMAWQPKNKRMFTSAFLKRYSGFGSQGVGGVYVLDFTSGTGSVSTSFTLQGVSPANGGSAIDLGSITRTGSADYTLPNSNSTDSWDLDAFNKIGKISYGDADVSEDGNTLWLVNLNQLALITVDISGTSSYPGEVNQYLLSDATGLPTCTNGVLRPWGLGFNKGKGYLGCMCTAESAGTAANMHAYVLSFDPANPTVFTSEVDFPMNYTREKAVDFPTYGIDIAGAWKPWISTWAQTGYSNNPPSETGYPQPCFTDIDFGDDGSMVLGFADRFGYQMGYQNYIPVSADNSQSSGDAAGDIVKVCRVNGAWVLEGGSGCDDNDSTLKSTLATDGPSNGGEFFYADYFDDTAVAPTYNHNETFIGSLGVLKGTNEVLTTNYDPVNGSNFAFDLGTNWYNTRTGARTDDFRIVASGPSASKGNNLGDFAF